MLWSLKSGRPRLLRASKRYLDYLGVNLDGKTHSLHRLVAEHFIDNPLLKAEVNHIDGDKTNNCFSNLEWCTRSENEQHARKTGLKKQVVGEACHRAKLTESEVLKIKELWSTGKYKQQELAKKFNISRQVIYDIRKGRRWKHLL